MNITLQPSFEFNIEQLLSLHHKANLTPFQHGMPPTTDKENIKIRESMNSSSWKEGKKRTYIILVDGTLAGRLSFEISEERADVSFWLIPEFRHKGIMKIALETGLNECFKSNLANVFHASCLDTNSNGQDFLKSIGFSKMDSSLALFDNFILTKKQFLAS